MKKLFTLLLAIMVSIGTMFAESGTCGENLTWDLTDGVLTISGTGAMTDFLYSSSVPWYSLRSSITSLIIGSSVTSIGSSAFSGCSSLTSVTIPNSVTSIGSSAFSSCTGLTFLEIPNSVTSIGRLTFKGCRRLTSIEIPNSVTSIGYYAFGDCTGLTSVTIGNSVTSIGSSAFYRCTGLTSVSISNSVTNIENEAFYSCSSLTSLTLPNSVTSIGEMAFSGCTALLDLHVPNTVTTIEPGAFNLVPNVYYSGTAIGRPWGAKCINGYVEGLFVYNNDTKKYLKACLPSISGRVIIPQGVIHIDEKAFYYCSQITSVVIPEGVTLIDDYAFQGCSRISSITIPSTVREMYRYIFSGCSNLKRVYACPTTPPYHEGTQGGFSFPKGITIYVPVGYSGAYQNAQYWEGLNYIEMDAVSSNQTVRTTSFSLELNHNFWELDSLFIDSIGIAGKEQQYGNVLEYIGLEPNTEYSDIHVVLTSNTGETDTVNVSFTTPALELTTKESKAVSSTTALLFAETNMSDAETNCGFEWKRENAPESMAGTKVYCPVASGQMAGRLKNLKDDVYYKYRAFYQSAAGKMYYGDWQYIFTGDATVKFDPVLYTYAATVVRENEATLSGYALAGSEDFTEQGFEYWAESRTTEPTTMSLRKMKNALGEHFFVPASGISMRVTLTDLDAGTVYKYRAYGKAGDQVYYGAEQTFTTTGKYVAPSYLITFVNWDGTELQKSQVATGTLPEYNGETPVRPDDEQYTYIFKGWTPELLEVTEDAVYTAEFTAEEATALINIESDQIQCTKILCNGQIFIHRGDKTYTLQGQEVK